jgi:putative ATPase
MLKLSAVMDGVKAIREAVAVGQTERAAGRQCVLFVDEVHRFNKAQQDAFLPFVEDGTLTLIGATTENPAFELNSALLSRARVYRLQPLEPGLSKRSCSVAARKLGLILDADQRHRLALAADGDARRALNLLEVAASLADAGGQLADATCSRRCCRARRDVSTRAVTRFTTRYRHCTKRCGAARRMAPCTGTAACSMAAVTRCTSRGG